MQRIIAAAFFSVIIGFAIFQVGCTLSVGNPPAPVYAPPRLNRAPLPGLRHMDTGPNTIIIITLNPRLLRCWKKSVFLLFGDPVAGIGGPSFRNSY